jgi:hypothetical protein
MATSIGKMSYAKLMAQKKVIDDALYARRGEAVQALADDFAKKLESDGFTVAEGIAALRATSAPSKPAKKTRVKRGTAPKKAAPASQDSEGNKPEAGVTYKHPTTGAQWTKKEKGAPNKDFIALVQAGKTWNELRAG